AIALSKIAAACSPRALPGSGCAAAHRATIARRRLPARRCRDSAFARDRRRRRAAANQL
ncbi:hypothetical protein Dimus_020327, partial [Dionaea muscipula]